MNRSLRSSLISSSVIAFAVLGCNSILDNQPGVPTTVDGASALPDPGMVPGALEQDSGTTSDSGEKPSADCPTGMRMCAGACVSLIDPLYGCGDPSCSPCKSTRSTMGCQGRQCIVTGCDSGYADCNANAADGCETDRSKATSCGACNAVCGAAAPLCAPAGASFQCTDGCTPVAPLNCGAECVDPTTSANHCGGCNKKCAAVENGTTACAASLCSYTCKPLFHACTVAGTCAANTDPAACGPACSVCPARGNAVPTCAADACGFTCNAGNGDCDLDPANGCEINLTIDNAHCGVCGVACVGGQTCVAGVCQ